ncbi:GNAT family N-acetyltransferase [Paramicrobacterium chengjingii]|uniref:GNAT family N-acetyltransferase n=1 Tax=Paramicrobacterium chengjingii TaxID=2769067 RepID=UPI001F1D0A9D|nr:GNAT family N-acetyltransferase [Microbacterium chengjingii]
MGPDADGDKLITVSAPEYSIRQTVESDWREVRDLRLEMLRDTPIGYGETLDNAHGKGEAEWRVRAKRGTAEHGIALVAIDSSGRWVGTMGGFVPEHETTPILVGVYVAPRCRGRQAGVTDALLDSIEEWARTESNLLMLHVHEDNARARNAYERRGFVQTGHTEPYSLDVSKNELEMIKRL